MISPARALVFSPRVAQVRSYDDLVPLHCVAFGGHDECARVLLK